MEIATSHPESERPRFTRDPLTKGRYACLFRKSRDNGNTVVAWRCTGFNINHVFFSKLF